MKSRAVFLNKIKNTIIVPHFVFAVLSARKDAVVIGTPINLQYQSLVGFPL
jgi:hypothetical protein